MLLEELADRLSFVRGEIVEDDVNLLPGRAQGYDLLQKGDELTTGMASSGFAVDTTGGGIERGVQGERSVPVVLEAVTFDASHFDFLVLLSESERAAEPWRRRSRTIRLNLRFYLRPAAIKAGVLRVGDDGRMYDASGNLVRRFGFHNLRHSLSTTLITVEREDPRTVQDIMRHSNSSTTLDLYTQSTMEQRVAAQEKVLGRILPQNERVN